MATQSIPLDLQNAYLPICLCLKISEHMQPDQQTPTPENPPIPQPIATPIATPVTPSVAPTVTPPTPKPPHSSSPAVQIVWQWLTYALWSWTLCALTVLLSGVLTYFIVEKNGEYEFLIYTLATLVVLLPLAFIADRIYSKIEPLQKHGFAAVVMVLNAVLVFLIALGGIITAVIALFTLFINPGDSSSKVIIIISAGVVAAMGIMLFLRIMRPAKLQKFAKYFPYIVLIIAGLSVVAGMVGPFRAQVAGRQDKLIEEGLSSVNESIQTYQRKNKALPQNLETLKPYSQQGKDLIAQRRVEYRIITQSISDNKDANVNFEYGIGRSQRIITDPVDGKYELCVTYKQAKNNKYSYDEDSSSTYLSTSSHKAGRQCYTLTANAY